MRRITIVRSTAAALFAVLLPLAAWAGNVSSDADVTIELPSDGSLYTLKSGAGFDQMDVSAGTLTFSANSGSSVSADIRSGGKKTLTNSRNIASVCGDTESSVVISSGAGDTTVTPSGTCGTSGGGGGTSGGGGGGGGGGGSSAAAPAPATVDKVTQLKQQIAAVQDQIAQKIKAAGGTLASLFSRNLALGDRSDDVKNLQQLLTADKNIYPEGLASGFFGPATLRAVKRFQAKYGLPQVGNVGPQTRAKLNEVFGSVPSVPAVPIVPVAPVSDVAPGGAVSANIPSRNLNPGEKGDEVKALQALLATDKEIYPEGIANGVYGPATTRAIRRFQLKHGVIQNADELGNGRTGPKTRAKLQEIFGSTSAAPAPSSSGSTTPSPQSAAVGTSDQAKVLQEQIQALQAKILQEQIKALQEKINAAKK